MKIRIRRIYMKADTTVGCLQIENHEHKWEFVCDTIEPHAIPWEEKPLIGQKAGKRIAGQTAIPEGKYRVKLCSSKTHKRFMPTLVRVPEFKTIVLRTGKTPEQSRGDILVGRLRAVEGGHASDAPHLEDSLKTFNRLFSLIVNAIKDGETVWLEVRSAKGWTFPSLERKFRS